ncbi:hypothetical protein OROGR_003336 [Orobanche gracilis]
MAEKVSVMVLKVDLQCPCCYKKVKKILCKFPHDLLGINRENNHKNEGSNHNYSYLTQRDRVILQSAIAENPLYGFYEIAQSKQSDVAKMKQPDVAKKPQGNGEWTKFVGKGKGKQA